MIANLFKRCKFSKEIIILQSCYNSATFS